MAAFMTLTDEAYRLHLNLAPHTPAPVSVLHAARRDSAAFQLIVQSDHFYSLNVGRQHWVTHRSHHLGKQEHLRLQVEAPFPVCLNIEEFLPDDDDIRKADILLAQEVRESAANLPTAVWAEVNIPADAQPGEYAVKARLYGAFDREDERLLHEEALTLIISPVLMPEPAEWKFYLDLWQHSSNIARKHDVPLWSEEHFEVLEHYAKSLAQLGQKSITVIASEIPWRGQSCREPFTHSGNLFEYSMITITRGTDGVYRYDFTVMQRYIDLCTRVGIRGDIEVIGLINVWNEAKYDGGPLCPDYPEAIILRYFDEASGCIRYVREREVICDYVRALSDYFIRTGQLERVRIAADEPGDIEKYRESLTLLKALAPQLRCKTAINHAEFIEEFHDRIDDFSPYLHCTIREYERLRRYQKEYPDKKFLWYVCCGPTVPNTFLRTAPIESRVIGLLTSFLRFDGFLRWAYTIWPDDPRKDIRFSAFEAGDNCFVYPGSNGRPLLSLRYKNLRRGISDYELIEILRAKQGDAAADKLLSRVLHIQEIAELWPEEGQPENKQLLSLSWQDYDDMKAALLKALES